MRRQLRAQATPAEKLLWEKFRRGAFHGLNIHRQHSIGNYIADFYCAHPRMIIEIDGEVHNQEEQHEKDFHRDENLREMGYIVLRFSNHEVLTNTKAVLQAIETAIRK